MSSIAEFFEENKYVYLSDVLDEKICKELTDYMFHLYESGNLIKDTQCPLSDSIYGNVAFDDLLRKLAKPLSEQLDIDLDPAYTYARLYRPGEELEKHTDRPSCEISGTMTLGFAPSTSVWPIFFGLNDEDLTGEKFDIDTGDLVIYRGNELPHWRARFEGTWQVQVFFHYVDKNGPHKEFRNDKRPEE